MSQLFLRCLAVPFVLCPAASAGSNVTMTCQRAGDSWPASFTAQLTGTQTTAAGCVGSGNATSTAMLLVAPTATLLGPPSLFVCNSSATLNASFVVQSTTNTAVSLVVNGTGAVCTTAASTGGCKGRGGGWEVTSRHRLSSNMLKQSAVCSAFHVAFVERLHVCGK